MAERVDPSWQLWYDIYDLVNDDDEIAQEEIDCIMDQAEGYRFQMRCCGCEYILQEHNESGLRKLMGWTSPPSVCLPPRHRAGSP